MKNKVGTTKLKDEFSGEEIHKGSTTLEVPQKVVLEQISEKKRALLKITCPLHNSKSIELTGRDFVIGRSSKCHIQIPLKDISRKHARIFFRDEEYYILDLGSTNSIYLNGVKIDRCILHNGDQIQIGETRMIFCEQTTFARP